MIHREHPFLSAPEERSPARRLRGRLAAPVTIVTAGAGKGRAGLTVSSLFVVEGEPSLIEMVIGPTSDLWDTVAGTGRFVVHVCREAHQDVAEVFAGLRPSPGGPFSAVDNEPSDWGPVLAGLATRAFCTLLSQSEVGYAGVVTGTIDRVEAAELDDPLVHFRGAYRRVD